MTSLEKLQKESLEQHHKDSLEQNKYRAQSITVGRAGGTSTEIMLRKTNGDYIFQILHPAEVVELINQLAAGIGCHIHIKPRKDFSSYREWRQLEEDDLSHLNGHAPFGELTNDFNSVGGGFLSNDRPFSIQNNKNKVLELLNNFVKQIEEDNVAINRQAEQKNSKKRK